MNEWMIGEGSGGSGGEHYFALPVGEKLFEFEIEAVLGHGGFGITYLARDTLLDEQVAIKEFFPNDFAVRATDATVRGKSAQDQGEFEAGVKAFLAEARLMARFRHRNIVHVRRFFELHGTGYIVQDYEEGQTLGQRLAEGPIGEAELRRLLLGVLDGLEAVHERAILHRDLKPDNIILRADGTPVLIDFGAAREFAGRHSRSITAIASGGYTPPEQWGVGGQQGPWSDLYALGAIAYRVVTGTAPPMSLQRLRKDPLVPALVAAAGKYDTPLLTLIDWMLKVDESERPGSAALVREALAGETIPPGVSEPPVSEVMVTAIARGRVHLTFASHITADVLELAFLVTPPGEYLAPSSGAAPTWHKQPHYFSLGRVPGATGAVFEAGSEIANSIPDKATVLMISADGFVRAQGVWNRPPVVRPSRVWTKIAAGIVLMIAVAAALYWVYDAHQKQQAQQAAERAFTVAGFQREQLRQLLASCESGCTADLMRRIQGRLDTITAEEATYRAAEGDPTKLHEYARSCQACLNRGDAEERARQIEQQKQTAERRRLELQLTAAGFQREQLRQLLASCESGCTDDLIRQIQGRLDTITAEEATYRSAGDDPIKLRAYANSCQACLDRGDAEERARQIEQQRQSVERQRLEQQLQAAGYQQNQLQHFIANCGPSCPSDLRAQAQSRIDAQKKTLYLDTKDGRIVIKLRPDLAPMHAERIKMLARENFYDNVPFHRVIDGFMAQTGDGQYGNGTGGSKYPNLPAEFSNVPFKRGIVGMARKGGDNDSANSQFFIMFAEAPSLNGQYTVIGEVVSGMNVVDKIKKGSQAQNGAVNNPDKIVRMQVAD